jgi:hypothetical protein
VKECSRCLEFKPHSEFWKDKSRDDGFCKSCKRCLSGKGPPPRARPTAKRAKPAKQRHDFLTRLYGLSHEDYENMLDAQGYKCSVCRVMDKDAPRGRLYVDHCHKTGAIRGLLCASCNMSVGNHSADMLRRMADYVDGGEDGRRAHARTVQVLADRPRRSD